jgi:hypothetical protein
MVRKILFAALSLLLALASALAFARIGNSEAAFAPAPGLGVDVFAKRDQKSNGGGSGFSPAELCEHAEEWRDGDTI